MPLDYRYTPPIPDGYQIFIGDVEVVGIYYRLKAAKRFARGADHEIRLEHEPHNRHDPNAIKVMGISRGWLFRRARQIGYVPADLAARIIRGGHLDVIKPRLRNVWRGGFFRTVIVVRFDILAPKQRVAIARRR